MTIISPPIPNSYWIEPGRLLAGEYPGDTGLLGLTHRLDAFLNAGIDTFIDLTRPDELTPYDSILLDRAGFHKIEVSYTRLPVRDFGVPSLSTMKAVLDSVDLAVSMGRNVYVHCWGGVGRTGTAVGCYLVRHGLTGAQALAQIAEWWQDIPKHVHHPRSPETDEQVRFIQNWRELA